MKIQRQTTSFCPTCYREVPAVIESRQTSVSMRKTCVEHGEQVGEVERDGQFYEFVRGVSSSSIYEGYFVDVTMRCNLRCSPCYAPLVKQDPAGEYSIGRIVQECRTAARFAPFLITGGEPTLRDDLPELISKMREVRPDVFPELLTNGIRLANSDAGMKIMTQLTGERGHVHINLSIHRAETDAWKEVLGQARLLGRTLNSAMIVVDSKESFLEALEICEEWRDVVVCFRLKGATKIWNEQRPERRLFVSEMLQWLEDSGEGYEFLNHPGCNQKVTFVNVLTQRSKLWLMLVSWYDVTNVDLQEIDCAPWYRASTGEVCNFVKKGLIEEGIQSGWLNGNKTQNHYMVRQHLPPAHSGLLHGAPTQWDSDCPKCGGKAAFQPASGLVASQLFCAKCGTVPNRPPLVEAPT